MVNYQHSIISRSGSQSDNLLGGDLDEEIEVHVEMLPPESEDPAPLLSGEVGGLDAVQDPRHGPACPHVVPVRADEGADVPPRTLLILTRLHRWGLAVKCWRSQWTQTRIMK